MNSEGQTAQPLVVDTIQVWRTQAGVELIRVKPDNTAVIVPSAMLSGDLRLLGEACKAAADFIDERMKQDS